MLNFDGMARTPNRSRQAHEVLAALAERPRTWHYGYQLSKQTGLTSGTLYPLLIRLSDQGLLESRWQEPDRPGRPARHAYRLTPSGVALAREVSDHRAAVVTRRRVGELPVLALAMMWGQHLNRPVDRKAGWKPEYFVPLFVMDAAKYRGFRGVRYTSVHGYGTNLVIFDRDASVTNVGDPEIRELKDPAQDIPSFSDDDTMF